MNRLLVAIMSFTLPLSLSAQDVPEVTTDATDIILDIPYFEVTTEAGLEAYAVVLKSPLSLEQPAFSVDLPTLLEVAVIDPGVPVGCEEEEDPSGELEDSYLYIENNDTDEDIGVHGLFDGGDGFSVLCVFAPNGDLILETRPRNELGDLGISGIFFESVEPEYDEYSIEDLKSDFPEGQYAVRGTTPDGDVFEGEATFSHDIPEAAEITSPAIVEDEEDADEAIVDPSSVVVSWEPVSETIDGDSINVTAYEVIVTKEDHEDPNGFSRPIYDVHLPPTLTSLAVPEEFFEADTLYEVEVLVLELSGNQTISVGFFMTE